MKYVCFLVVLFSLSVFSQERATVYGKIVSRSKNLEGIHVSNINTSNYTTTAKNGYFDIKAKENDTLRFSSSLFIGYNMVLDSISLQKELIFVPLEESELSTQLNEIYISKINSESLGIVPKGIKKYTPGERRLYSATSNNGIIPLGLIINSITGKTKMLKKALVYEKQELRKEKLLKYFSEEYIKDNYNIPDDYINGFVYRSVLDREIINNLDSGSVNTEYMQVRLGVLAMEFLQGIKDIEKK